MLPGYCGGRCLQLHRTLRWDVVLDTAVDVWSIGCIFAELYNMAPLFTGENDIDQLCGPPRAPAMEQLLFPHPSPLADVWRRRARQSQRRRDPVPAQMWACQAALHRPTT
jgi:hypothetical protein